MTQLPSSAGERAGARVNVYLAGALLLGLFAVLAAVGCGGGGEGGGPADLSKIGGGGGAATVTFSGKIKPLINSNCACHLNGASQNGFNMDTYDNLIAGGNSGALGFPEVVPGDPAASLIYMKVSMDTPPVGARMPFGGPFLSTSDQNLIFTWIKEGAPNN